MVLGLRYGVSNSVGKGGLGVVEVWGMQQWKGRTDRD